MIFGASTTARWLIEIGVLELSDEPLEMRVFLNAVFGVDGGNARRLLPELIGDVIPLELSRFVGGLAEGYYNASERRRRRVDPVAEVAKAIATLNPEVPHEPCRLAAAYLFWGLYALVYGELPEVGHQALTAQ